MILRTYMCEFCGHRLEVELSADQWDIEAPDCPNCAEHEQMGQEFKPPAIGGSTYAQAARIAETIASEDYNVADIQSPSRSGREVRYRDQGAEAIPQSTWAAASGQLQQAMALGRQTRLQHGDGLDVLKGALKSGAQRDLLADAKRRSFRVY